MRARKAPPATYADIEALPPHQVGEILGGELFASPRPAFGHASAASRLGMDIGGPFDRGRGGPGGWRILDEPELHFGENVLVPDLAGWRLERLPNAPPPSTPFLTLAPDWVCEVLSPSTARLDRVLKMEVYAREQIRHLWLVDPLNRTLEIFRLEDGRWSRISAFADEEQIRAEPFDAVELSLGTLWS
jgi:Uma2 family endonuclease